MHVDYEKARAALAVAGRQTAELLRSAGQGEVRPKGSQWTIGEIGAHLAIALEGFTSAAQGQPEVVEAFIPRTECFPDRLAEVTAKTLTIEPERDPVALASLIARRVDRFLCATANRSGAERVPTPWYGEGVSLSLATATGVLLGEQLFHGYDIAKTIRRPWPLEPDHVRLILGAATSLMPLAVNPQAAARVQATYDIRIRGGPRFLAVVENAAVRIETWTSRPVDCHISADPLAFALVAYGRIGQWGPIAKAELVAWGRRPWLALRFKSLFFNP